MASGKLEAMMVCRMYGYPLDENEQAEYDNFAYGNCTSTDNTTANLPLKFQNIRGYVDNQNYITISELFENNWLFVGSTTYRSEYIQMIFYKVSSD